MYSLATAVAAAAAEATAARAKQAGYGIILLKAKPTNGSAKRLAKQCETNTHSRIQTHTKICIHVCALLSLFLLFR